MEGSDITPIAGINLTFRFPYNSMRGIWVATYLPINYFHRIGTIKTDMKNPKLYVYIDNT